MNFKKRVKLYINEEEYDLPDTPEEASNVDNEEEIVKQIFKIIFDILNEEYRSDKRFFETFKKELLEKTKKDKVAMHKDNSGVITSYIREIIHDKIDKAAQSTFEKFLNGLTMRELPRILPS